jgi:hypothetical protein
MSKNPESGDEEEEFEGLPEEEDEDEFDDEGIFRIL